MLRIKTRLLFVGVPMLLVVLFFSVATLAYAQSSPSICPFQWSRNLKIGTIGDDVLKLQQFLNADPSTALTSSGLGSPGYETSKYGALTSRAVVKFQEKYQGEVLTPAGLTKGSGFVGAKTMAKLNALCATKIVTSTTTSAATSSSPVVNDALTITVPDQPAPTIIAAGAGGVPFISVTLSAGDKDVTVNSITVERTGLGTDGAFLNIALNDPDGLQIGIQPSFASDHKAKLRQPFTVLAHTSQTLSITANMQSDLTNFVGQAPILQIDSIDASSPVVGLFPVRSNPQTLNNTLVIGGATAIVSPYDPSTATNHYINDTGVRFSGIRITANSQEDLTLYNIIWNQVGTAGSDDLANVVTVVNGSSTPTIIKGRFYVSIFTPAIVIPKGQSIDVYIKGDLKPSGARRTVEFDIADNSDDVALSGNTYGFGVSISPAGNTATAGHSVFITDDGTTGGITGNPFYAGSVTTINGGTAVSVSK